MKKLSRHTDMANIPGVEKDSIEYLLDGPVRILIVDDEEGIREPLKEFLKSLGYQVFTSSDPFQALEVIKAQFIHLVIVDLCLPGMDGIELQKRITAISRDTMQIIITGYESLDSALKTLKAGAYDYLSKPIKLKTLEMVVKNCLEKQQLEVENRHLLERLKQTCEQLKEREEALEAKAAEADYYLNNILERANDIIFTLDRDGYFTYVNPKIESLGYHRDALIGSSFFSILYEKADAVSLYRAIKMERPDERKISLKDHHGVERPAIISTSPIYDAYLGISGVLGIAMDITHQGRLLADLMSSRETMEAPDKHHVLEDKRAIEEHAVLQEYNHRILSGIPLGIALVDKESKTLQSNLAFLDIFTLSADQVINQPISAYLPPQVLQVLEPSLDSAFKKNKIMELLEVEFKENKLDRRVVGLRLIPLIDQRGILDYLLLLVEDLTRSRSMKKEIQQREKANAMLELAKGVAHEVRNPLSIILGSIQYLRSIKAHEGDGITEHLNMMAESCELIGSVINELVNFARPLSMVFRLTEINSCLEKAVSLLRGRCQNRNIDLNLDLDPDLPFTACDEKHIGQVFINLIMNAVQAMPDGGKLSIRTKNEALHQRILITFEDTGIGIEPNDLKRIFDPFFSRKSKGIGLGLTVTKRIVEDHYGQIQVNSENGNGTQVHIHLPYRMQTSKGKGRKNQ